MAKATTTAKKSDASPAKLIDARIKELANGAALADPKGLFNSSLDGNVRRAIDIREGEKIDATALKALVRAAVALNKAKKKK
jgi:hypothetical protein